MPAIDPEGGNAYFFEGLPFAGLRSDEDGGTQKFWFEGLPFSDLFPAGSSAGDAAHGGFGLMGVGS